MSTQRRSKRHPVSATTQRASIDERAFPYDVNGTEKPYYRARAGLKEKLQRSTQQQYLSPDRADVSRRKQAFQAYTIRRKPPESRPQSAPAFASNLGGTTSLSKRESNHNARQELQEPPRPKMRPNSAHFLTTNARSTADLDVFAAERPTRSAGGSRRPFSHPTPPTNNIKILTSHEKMFYTDHFSKLTVQRGESQKYKLDDAYNRQTSYLDHTSSTLFAPSNEAITDYRLGRKPRLSGPPRVVQHKKTGLLLPKAVAEKKHRGSSRNELGGFYC